VAESWTWVLVVLGHNGEFTGLPFKYDKCIHDKRQTKRGEVFQSHVYCLLNTISVALQHSGMDYEHVFRKLLERKGTLGYQVNNNRESKDFIM